MYDVRLSQASFPAVSGSGVLDTTISSVLRQAAAGDPGAEALLEAGFGGVLGRRWTWAELLSDSERLAAALASRYAPGERIAVWSPNSPEWLMLEFASAMAGLVLVTANPSYQARELRFVLEQSRACALFLVREHRGNPMAGIAATAVEGLDAIREVVDMEDADAFFRRGSRDATLPEVAPGDAAQIQYTSGTTGFPKGAVLTHRGLTNNARFVFERGGVGEGQTVLIFMPMFHTAGCSLLALGAVQFRCRVIMARMFEAAAMNAIVEAEKVESIMGVPTMLVAMLEAQGAHRRDLSSVKLMISGGSMVPPELIRRVKAEFGCEFETVYGQTESSPVLTQTFADDALEDLCETVGQPLPNTEVSIRDTRTNLPVAAGQIGEICARGYCLMIGYNDNPQATAAAIDAEGWLHTGDLGTMDERGYVRVTGRVKEMIIRGGENLFPAEIENVLLEHPDVAEAAVVGIPDERWGEVAACFVRLAAGASFDREVLVRHCRSQLSPQKTPAHWVEIGEWPLTGSGKIQKFVLRDRFVAGEWAR
jgi:fatty-acyl-CoA synthase